MKSPDRSASVSGVEALGLVYLALPTVIFVAGWIVSPVGPIAALCVAVAVLTVLDRRDRSGRLGILAVPVVAIAGLWTLLGGLGHFVYANSDWVVRDAVLLDLVREPWPVTYRVDGATLLLRAPIGFFLPAAVVGKVAGVRAAELALFAWAALGVALVLLMMVRDRPTLRTALIRLAVFIVFSGADILGSFAHYNPTAVGTHLEWWAYLFQYSSQTTQLFWVPNHALPGWLAIAWLTSQDPKRLPIVPALLFVLFAPLWSPLTAIGIAPIVAVAVLRRRALGPSMDVRLLLVTAACVVLVYPYLTAGSDRVASGSNASLRWVSEDLELRIVEFVALEFAGFALLLLRRDRRDPLLWTAIAVLLALPFYRFGPYNDLAMRASIPALALLAIGIGRWLATPLATTRDPVARSIALVLLAIGAVTPFMEVARAFRTPAWPMDTRASVVDVTRGTHYLTPAGGWWIDRFVERRR